MKSGFFGAMARLYWGLTAFVALLWVALVASVVAFAVGCTSLPEEERREIYGYVTNAAERVLAKIEEERDTEAAGAGGEETAPVTADEQSSAASPAATPAASVALDFRYGGFNGSKAVEDPNTQIGSVRFTRDSVSHKWVKGNLSNWGLAKDDAGAIACAFFWSESENAWIGAKFEWTSTSRTTRSLKNLNEGYHGWNASAFHAAKRKAYCIFSKDGKKRTNLAEDGK